MESVCTGNRTKGSNPFLSATYSRCALVRGVDVWVNTPTRLEEASGTSGMKAGINGVLNLSILDGWWNEYFDGINGWAIPTADAGGEAHSAEAVRFRIKQMIDHEAPDAILSDDAIVARLKTANIDIAPP